MAYPIGQRATSYSVLALYFYKSLFSLEIPALSYQPDVLQMLLVEIAAHNKEYPSRSHCYA
jgi:hypothetical protein